MSTRQRQQPRSKGSTLDVGGFSIRDVQYVADDRQPRHYHEETTATLILHGSLEEVVGSARERALPLSVVFKPAGTEHANQIGPEGATTLQLEFDAEFLETPELSVLPSDWGWVHGGHVARRFIDLFAAWRTARGDTAILESQVYDLLGELWKGGVSRGDATDSRPPPWLSATVEELEDTFESPRRVRDLALDAGVHPVALARAHRRHFGCSISDRIRRRRVVAAAALMGHDVALSSIAYRTGFSDQSHLTRVFKSVAGITPGAYRRFLTG